MSRSVLLASGPWMAAGAIACSTLLALTVPMLTRGKALPPSGIVPSLRTTITARLSPDQAQELPYPPDCFPGRRDINTPYGSVRVYEWGPEDGERILFVHGLSLPSISLGNLAEDFVQRGYRVMLFDLYGRGYSEAPQNIPYDARLYSAQILFVLQSSPLNWLNPGFHLIGYSLGGGLAASFASRFPSHLRSLTLITPCGLIRPEHVDWKSKLLYKWNLLPESWVRSLVRRRIDIPDYEPPLVSSNDESPTPLPEQGRGTGDASGGASFDFAPVSRHRPHVTVNDVLAWQMRHHEGYMGAFTSTMSHAPIYQPQRDWVVLADILADREQRLDRVLIVLGETDPIIREDEVIEDARRVLGEEHVEFVVMDSGHEVPITKSEEVAEAVVGFWTS